MFGIIFEPSLTKLLQETLYEIPKENIVTE